MRFHDGGSHGGVTDRRRIGSLGASLHIRKLVPKRCDAAGRELFGYDSHRRMGHAGARAVCKHEARLSVGWREQQAGNTGALVDGDRD